MVCLPLAIYIPNTPIEEPIEEVEGVLIMFADLFEEPIEVPPKRSYDHKIELVPGINSVSTRPYKYFFHL